MLTKKVTVAFKDGTVVKLDMPYRKNEKYGTPFVRLGTKLQRETGGKVAGIADSKGALWVGHNGDGDLFHKLTGDVFKATSAGAIKNPSLKGMFSTAKAKVKSGISKAKAAYTKRRPAKNPRFAVSLESQHGTKPVGIIEAPNFLSAYSAAKKEYGPDIDVDVMNPIRRYVVTKRKKA